MELLARTIPHLAWVLSGRSPRKAAVLMFALWTFVVRNKTGSGREAVFRFRFEHTDFTLALQSNADIAVLREVFLLREYEWQPIRDPKVIVDLGAHFGDTTLYYHLRFPGATVVAVEPSPETFKRLVRNTRGIPSIIPVHAAIGDHDGNVNFYIAKNSFGSSLQKREEGTAATVVPMLTLKTLFARCAIARADVVKFDIEGGEEQLFAGANPREFADAFIGEVHEDLMKKSVQEFVRQFGDDFETKLEKLPQRGRYLFRARLK